MNIAVIGKGTASIVTTLQLIKSGYEVTILYDPKTKPINVGESSTPLFVDLLYDALGISLHQLVTDGVASYKAGVNFDGWGNGKQFYYHFYNQKTAIHFETQLFNDYIHKILEQRGIKYIPTKVKTIECDYNNLKVTIDGLKYDFVVSCSGWGDAVYDKPIIETVNSAILFSKNYEDYSKYHTFHLATEDGWQFGLPFPQKNIFKCGYLYNNNLISKEEVLKKLDLDIDYGEYSWTPKSATTMLKSFLLASNGNELFFFEPLQTLSIHYYVECAIKISQFLEDRSEYNFDKINMQYSIMMNHNQISLAYHYQFGSKYDTPFWNNIKKRSSIIMDGSYWGRGDIFLRKVYMDTKYKLNGEESTSQLGIFEWQDHQLILNGMNNK